VASLARGDLPFHPVVRWGQDLQREEEMSDIPPISYAQKVTESRGAKAWHIIVTGLGIPALLLVSGWGLSQIVQIKEQLAAVQTFERRIEQEERATAMLMRNDGDAREARAIMNGRINGLENRFTILERRQ